MVRILLQYVGMLPQNLRERSYLIIEDKGVGKGEKFANNCCVQIKEKGIWRRGLQREAGK
jgi:hypothetical protein